MSYGNDGGGGKRSQYQHQEGRGSLFWSKNKKGPKSPDLTGEIVVGGQTIQIMAWQNQSQRGLDYLSLRVVDENDQRRGNQNEHAPRGGGYGGQQGVYQGRGGQNSGQRGNGPSRGGYGGGQQSGGRNLPQGVRRGYYSNDNGGGQDQGYPPDDAEGG